MTKRIVILGSTGSIGTQTLEVAAAMGEQVEVVGLATGRQIELLAEQARRFRPRAVAVGDADLAPRLQELLGPNGPEVLAGPAGVALLATLEQANLVMAAIVGLAGLQPAVAALEAGKDLALANKEVLVGAGELVMPLARRRNCAILPVDSEHSALFQCLIGEPVGAVSKLILTASGGPFRGWRRDHLEHATPAQALRHPRWNMGRKISIDSATLMNKGLEIIEARWLFDMDASRIDVVVHPESLVHSLVEFADGSLKAQLGPADMRLPIQYALTYPERAANPFSRLDLVAAGRLTFEPPDVETFRCLHLARQAAASGGSMPTVMNAANEVAVQAFLDGQIGFFDIAAVIERVMEQHQGGPLTALDDVLEADRWARSAAAQAVQQEVGVQ